MSLKSTFIQKALAQYMDDVTERFRVAAQRSKVGVTGEAIRSLSYQVLQTSSEGGIAKLSFKEYLRMVDMGAGRGHPLGGLRSTTLSLQSQNRTGKAFIKDRIRKPKKIYSKTAYGNLTWLQNQLLYGYTEQAITDLKKEMQ